MTTAATAPQPEAPLVFVEKQRSALRLAALSPDAVAAGLTVGLDLASARAQFPALTVVDYDPAGDARWLARIADRCDRFSPLVALDPPDGVLLDVTGAAHLWGGEARMATSVADHFSRLHIRLGSAATPMAAAALARFGEKGVETVHALPIAALRLEAQIETALRRAGLVSVGDLASRPTAPLAARFGSATVLALQRLLGHADNRLSPRRRPPALVVERRFAEPIATTDVALSVLDELLAEAALALDRGGCGGRRFAARLFRTDNAVRNLTVETSRPVRDPAVVGRLFRERIDTLADPIDPGFGFDLIRLAVPVLEPLAPTQLALEGGTVAEDALAALIDRLSTRLGRNRVRRFAPRDNHIPEQASLTFPAADPRPVAVWPVLEPGEPPLRPLQLFDPPQRIEVIAEVPDGPPSRFRWYRTTHEVMCHEGPERIASEWWRGDGFAPTRDYYRIEDASGRRFWIFRHGLYDSKRAAPAWYIHGLFA